jgi:hypothetical protein
MALSRAATSARWSRLCNYDDRGADVERLLKSQRDRTSSERVAVDLQKVTEALTGLSTLTQTSEKETAA